jgi:hypothetical protein
VSAFVRQVLFLFLLGVASTPAIAQPRISEMYPVWISTAAEKSDETVTLTNPSYLTLFKLRPNEGYGLVDPAKDEKGKERLPIGEHLIRVPGPLFVACQAVRPKGNERFTCLLDEDSDGYFDRIYRPGAATNLFIAPFQLYGLSFEPMSGPAGYRSIDEQAEFRPSEFIMQYSVQGKLNIINFCFEPYRRKASWGVPHLVDDCLVLNMTHKRGSLRYPFSKTVHDNQITIQSFDEVTKAMTFRLSRSNTELPITFGFESN